jgi:ketosteroid isomerase-like protein
MEPHSSEPQVEAIRKALGAFNSGDTEAFLDAFDPAVEWHPSSRSPFRGVFRGREGIAELFGNWREAWQEVRLDAEDPVGAGDQVAVTGHFVGIAAGSGERTEFRRTGVFHLRDGKIVRVDDYDDRAEALRAIEGQPAA